MQNQKTSYIFVQREYYLRNLLLQASHSLTTVYVVQANSAPEHHIEKERDLHAKIPVRRTMSLRDASGVCWWILAQYKCSVKFIESMSWLIDSQDEAGCHLHLYVSQDLVLKDITKGTIITVKKHLLCKILPWYANTIVWKGVRLMDDGYKSRPNNAILLRTYHCLPMIMPYNPYVMVGKQGAIFTVLTRVQEWRCTQDFCTRIFKHIKIVSLLSICNANE